MPDTVSLKKNFEFKLVYKNGKSLANKHLVMYVMNNNLGYNRIGISVSKKVGNSVTRNYIKRIIRESYKMSSADIKLGADIIIIARTSIKDVKFSEVLSSLKHLLRLHKLQI